MHCEVLPLVLMCFAVEALVAVASRPVGVAHIWALHGLWLVAGSAGVGYAAHVKQSLQLALELLVSRPVQSAHVQFVSTSSSLAKCTHTSLEVMHVLSSVCRSPAVVRAPVSPQQTCVKTLSRVPCR